MIYIEHGARIPNNQNLTIASPTGDYEDTALIEFHDEGNRDIVTGSFQAQYIRYGNIVYMFNDPKELGEAILKIDPDSTHATAVFVRSTKELFDQMNSSTTEPSLAEAATVDSATVLPTVDHTSTTTPVTTKKTRTSSEKRSVQQTPTTTTRRSR